MTRARLILKEIPIIPGSGRAVGSFFLRGISLVFLMSSVASAQVTPGSKYISIGYGSVDGDFSIAARLSGQFREDMGVEVLMEFVPSKGAFSDIYSIVHYRYHLWPGKRIVPHLVGGAGSIIMVGRGGRTVDFVLSTGGGAAAYLTQSVACRLDVENYSLFLEDQTVQRQAVGAGIVLIF